MSIQKSAIVRITPTMAQQWINQSNIKNRNVSKGVVDTYAKYMIDGEWKVNGEAIKISKEGNVLDGQHRLLAIIKTNLSIPMFVIHDLDEDVFHTLDTGKKRVASDVLGMSGFHNTKLLSTGTKWYAYITKLVPRHYTISNSMILDIVENHPALIQWSSTHGGNSNAKKMMSGSTIAVFSLMDELHGRDLAEEFFISIANGENLEKGSPALEFRNRMINARATSGTQFRTEAQIAILIKACNAFIKGESVGVLRYSAEQVFPTLVGFKSHVFETDDDLL